MKYCKDCVFSRCFYTNQDGESELGCVVNVTVMHDMVNGGTYYATAPWCQQERKKGNTGWNSKYPDLLSSLLAYEYYNSGLPAVEKALEQMMEDK